MALRRGLSGLAGSVTRACRQPASASAFIPRLQAPFTTLPHVTRRDEETSFQGTRAFSSEIMHADTESDSPTVMAMKTPTAAIMYDQSNHATEPLTKTAAADHKAFTYMVLTGGRFIYASLGRAIVLKFILSMSASADVLALASLEVDLGAIDVGNTVTVKWRGKPVFIRRRSDTDIQAANDCNISELRDPQTDTERTVTPEWLIVLGVCTHLGCVPLSGAGDYGGWFCPCHGSHYDISGRIRKGPAPYNLEVPEYSFMDDTKVLIG